MLNLNWNLVGGRSTLKRYQCPDLLNQEPMRTQEKVLKWAVDIFGPIAKNRDERAARLVEEAIEIAQVEELPMEVIQRILERVYERPAGFLTQEIGGLMITLEALAENTGWDVGVCADDEWHRVQSKTPEWWKNKHAEKVAAGTADLTPVCQGERTDG
ncbi:hypothetical protein LCGC14_2461430 [marine sediment metagenome]|uniref:Uncharacterized protein n=1 Tax=marine sediment metagenome TaxID=412755 RepID=A0A0F9E708_9ZZZZ